MRMTSCSPRCGMALAAALMLGAAPAWSLDLAEAYRLALDHDATIRGSRAAAAVGREQLPQARALLLPQVSAAASRF